LAQALVAKGSIIFIMFRNYFKTAIRNLWRNKGFSFINIFGLSVGMTVAMLIGLWVQHELSMNTFHENRKNIGLVMKKTNFNDVKGVQDGVMLPLYDELKNNYPEVKNITRLDWGGSHSLISGEKKVGKDGHFADPGFLKMFTFPLVRGNVETALKDPYSIVLTQSLSQTLFGDDNPLGKVIRLDNRHDLIVSAVMQDVPKNSTLIFDFLVPYEYLVATDNFVKGAKDQWQNNFLMNMVELKEGVNMAQFSKRIEQIPQQKTNSSKESTLFLHPLEKWYLYSDFKEWTNTGGPIEYVRLFIIVGILVLIIACINFMNLSTARSEKRAREVGIRKAVGSQRRQLITQFLGESLVTAFIAFLVSLLLVQLSLPLLKEVGFRDVNFNVSNYSLLGICLGGCIITGLVAGLYPAVYLSGFAPVKVLKGTFQAGTAANLPRKILVVTQFSFSIALIIGTVIIFQQIQHAKTRPLGYNPDNLININLTDDLTKNYEVLKQNLLATGFLEAVTRSSSPMTGVYNQWDDFSWEGKDPNRKQLFSAIMVDHDYDRAAALKMKEGRFFSKQFATDSNAMVLNEAAVKLIGFKDPVGKIIKSGNQNFTVVGVAENVLMQNPYTPVKPGLYMLRPYFISQGLIRLKPNVNIRKALAAIQPVVEKLNPAFPFSYEFTDEIFAKKFQNENQVGSLAGIFAVLAVFISCLGLFGLASFMAERRTKEIGIRKVLGASLSQLWSLLSRDFILLIVISWIVASPIAWYFMHGWLQKYEYRIDVNPMIFFGAALIAIVISLLTISFQILKAAVANPIKSLRSE
jgi:putative ABC transport system permease protein